MSHGDSVHPAQSAVRLTYEDFLLFPDDGKRHEIIDGVHYVTAAPNAKHQTVLLEPGLDMSLDRIFRE